MRYIQILLVSILLHSNLLGQTQKLWVVDSLTKSPVEGVTMFANQNFYCSDSNGLILPVVSSGDLIWFKHISYEQLWLNYNLTMDTIFLSRKALYIKEITVTDKHKKNEFLDLGYYHMGSLLGHFNLINNLCIISVYIPNYDDNTYIDKIMLNIKSKKFSKDYYVYLYEPDSIGTPGRTLYKGHFFINTLKHEGIINVHDLNIKVPNNGVFIGLENTKKYKFNKFRLFRQGVIFKEFETNSPGVFIQFKEQVFNDNKGKWHNYSANLVPCFGLRVYQK